MHLIMNVHTLVFSLQKSAMTSIVHFAMDDICKNLEHMVTKEKSKVSWIK